MNKNQFAKWMAQKQVTIPALLLENYTVLGLNEQELIALLHIQSFLDQGERFVTPMQLSERMTLSHEDCTKLLSKLIRSQMLSLEKNSDESGMFYETYSLEPLWLRLIECLEAENQRTNENQSIELEGKLYKQVEQEFGRPLSPIEGETLSMWIDQDKHQPELIFVKAKRGSHFR